MKMNNILKKGILSNDELSSFLSELNIAPYKSDFQRWWRILYCSHHATDGLGLPAFLHWCGTDVDLRDVIEEATQSWDEITEINPIYNVDYLARELASQGKMRLQERLATSHPVKLSRKLKQLINEIRVREDVSHCVDEMAELGNLPQLEIYETFREIKDKTEVPLKILESMYESALARHNKNNTSWPDVRTIKGGKLKPLPTFNNFKHFCHIRGVRLVNNLMSHDTEIHLDGEVIDDLHLRDLMNEAGLSGFGTRLRPALKNLASENEPYHPIKAWLKDHKWDGVDRIELLVAKLNVLRCPPEIVRIYLTRWLLCGIGAVYSETGITNQSMLVLQGKPGCGKTTFFESLLPEDKRPKWFIGGIREPWNSEPKAKVINSWLIEITRLEELLIYGRVIKGRKRTLTDMSNFIDSGFDVIRTKETPRRAFFCAGISTYDERIAYAADRHYFVIPIDDINFNAQIDERQLWLQIKSLYDDGQRHHLLKSELDRHLRYSSILSTRPRWTIEKRGYVHATRQD